jgi:hypothetical protein
MLDEVISHDKTWSDKMKPKDQVYIPLSGKTSSRSRATLSNASLAAGHALYEKLADEHRWEGDERLCTGDRTQQL